MPRRELPPQGAPDQIALNRSQLDVEFSEAMALYGDPRIKLLALAEKAEREEDYATAARCYGEVAQYLAPKLRAMEVQANIQSTSVVFNIDLSGEEDDVSAAGVVDAQPE
jgi:hypothetical protein